MLLRKERGHEQKKKKESSHGQGEREEGKEEKQDMKLPRGGLRGRGHGERSSRQRGGYCLFSSNKCSPHQERGPLWPRQLLPIAASPPPPPHPCYSHEETCLFSFFGCLHIGSGSSINHHSCTLMAATTTSPRQRRRGRKQVVEKAGHTALWRKPLLPPFPDLVRQMRPKQDAVPWLFPLRLL